ncbi:MAG: hypothetical protein ACRD8O_09870 [Bryobacteraceae bacterium]
MGPVTGWTDLLPEMLRRVLGEPAFTTPVRSLRRWISRTWRERIAAGLPDSAALDLTARLCTPRADWNRTRAFVLPSDSPTFIRINLRGREKLGCVPPSDATALAEIEAGLRTFTDLDGERCICEVLSPQQVIGDGARIDMYPDLVVFWSGKKTLCGRGVRSPRYGEIARPAYVTGRSGNHSRGALAMVSPGACRYQAPERTLEGYDISATILSALGVPHDELPGQAVLMRP